MNTMIEIENLGFGYHRKRPVFSGLDLSLKTGHIYGLLGKNGVGKTTLLKLMSGLLFPKAGTVNIMGCDPRLRQPSLLSQLFFLPEEIWLPEMRPKQYARLLSPFYPEFSFESLEKAMEEFEVSDQAKLNHLSYGQRKKFLICLGIASNVRLLIMDEPTNGLDIPSKSSFRRLISSASVDDRCIMISTHQVRDLENLIDALIVMDNSRVYINATTGQIVERLSFRQVGQEEEVLYAEDSLRGKWGVVENTTGEESKLDMELFFNAVLKNPRKMTEIFNR